MSLSLRGQVVVSGRLAAANPTASIAAALVIGLGVLVALDPVTPAVALALELAAIRWAGVPLRLLAARSWPLLVSASGVGLTNAVFGDSADPWFAGLAIALRVLAVALPGVAVVLAIDPTDLADSLVQQLHVPPRFAYGALAALRLLPLLSQEWRTLGMARRARGIDAGGNPARRMQVFAGQVFALLVGAVRRGTRLALAMDARGFDSTGPRTIARPQVVQRSDRGLVVGAAVALSVSLGTSMVLGTFVPLWG